MPDLTDRVEEALLGAMICDGDQVLEIISQIGVDDFTDPARRAVWTEIKRLSEFAAGTTGHEFSDLILAATDDPAITSDYLTRLALSTPTPYATSVYARLVAEAALNRAITKLPTEPARTNNLSLRDVIYSASFATAQSALAQGKPAAPAPASERANREEQFVSGIIHHQELTDWIRLDPQILTAPGMRAIYKAALRVDQLGEPVDELTLAWRTASVIA